MNPQEKTLARLLFRNKVLESDGQKFEDIFTNIMNYAEPDFQQIKPWGNIGDRKNDGYIKSKNIYFQVYAPENISTSYPDVIDKLDTDFKGLLKQWSPIEEYYFVLNDKYNGINPDCAIKFKQLEKQHKIIMGFKTAKDLENILLDLADDQIQAVAGFLPDPKFLKTLDFSILNEVIGFILNLSLIPLEDDKISYPDWDEKIKFNKLTELSANYLNNGFQQVGNLENYLKNNSNFLADELEKKIHQLYLEEQKKGLLGDDLFWSIVNNASPKKETPYQTAVIIVMAKYFESCDIFEEPPKKNPKKGMSI